MLKRDVDKASLFVVTGAAFTHGLDLEATLQRSDEWREALGFG